MEQIERKFETTLVNDESLKTNQEQRSDQSFDIFGIDKIDKLAQSISEHAEMQNVLGDDSGIVRTRFEKEAQLKQMIERTQDLFVEKDTILSRQYTHHFWKTVFESREPFLALAKSKMETILGEQDSYQLKMRFFMLNIRDMLKNREVPENAWLAILRAYKHKLEASNRTLEESTPAIKEVFVQRFIEQINPKLKNPKTKQELEVGIQNISLRVRDPLNDDAVGTYVASDATIDLDMSHLEGSSEEGGLSREAHLLIAHEMLHVISSGQVVKHELTLKYDENSPIEKNIVIDSQWSGLQVSGFQTQRFTWLNEAMTENLAAEITDTLPSGYANERKLVNLLLLKGKKNIDVEFLVSAYFEKRGHQAEVSSKESFWSKLMDEIKESYNHDPRFLVKLDILIQNKGVEEAINLLENWDTQNPRVIDIELIENEEKE